MKSISTLIASIALLVIVLVLGGTSYLYISGIFTGKISTSFQVIPSASNTAIISNIGTNPITSFRSVTIDNEDATYLVTKQDNSLVGHWKFDEIDRATATDSSGKGNTGTFTGEIFNDGTINGATFASRQYGNGLNFDGIDDYVSTNLDVQPSAMPSTTWEAWVYPTRINYGTRQVILSNDDGSYDRSVIIEYSTSNFGVFTGSGVWQPVSVDVNQWQHIAVVYTPSDIEFYKNGVRYSFGSAPIGGISANKLQIGRNPGSGEYLQGQIDEVRIYSRALSQSEIQNDMDSLYPVDRTVAWYNFENDAKDRHNIVKGRYGPALSFLNSPTQQQYVSIPDNAVLNFGTSDFTMMGWVNIIQPTGAGSGIFGNYPHATQIGDLNIGIADDRTSLFLNHINTNNQGFVHYYDFSPYFGKWTHIAWVKNGNRDSFLYINGNLKQSFTAPFDYIINFQPDGTTGYYIANTGWTPGTMPMLVDDHRVYNRALSDQEVKANYNIGSQINAGETGAIKIYNQLSKGTHTLRLCTSSMCNTAILIVT